MKKVLLTSTALATLLLAGGLSVSAAVVTPANQDIPVTVNFANEAEFTFNADMTASDIDVDSTLITGTQSGTLTNVGGTLENLTSTDQSVTVSVTSALPGLVVSGGTTVTAEAVGTNSETADAVAFTINRTAALASTEDRVISVTAQDAGDNEDGPAF
ncbi:hypothetical protein [Enterococcus casseliflavus]|uniref:hypothetical protein n=1 Tax=Enterococcus casseliflavus TaxID=37734 RepID=UPI0039A6530D